MMFANSLGLDQGTSNTTDNACALSMVLNSVLVEVMIGFERN